MSESVARRSDQTIIKYFRTRLWTQGEAGRPRQVLRFGLLDDALQRVSAESLDATG
jgi:hypothetical protein